MRYSLKTIFIVVTVISLAISGSRLLLSDPYNNNYSQRFQAFLFDQFGIQIYPSIFEGEYTGGATSWGYEGYVAEYKVKKGELDGGQRIYYLNGQLARTFEYVTGLRHGIWIQCKEDGEIEWVEQFNMGEPWNGVCHEIDRKGFLGHYRDGKKWNGSWGYIDPVDDPSEMPNCELWINGKQVGLDQYITYHDINIEEWTDEDGFVHLDNFDLYSADLKKTLYGNMTSSTQGATD